MRKWTRVGMLSIALVGLGLAWTEWRRPKGAPLLPADAPNLVAAPAPTGRPDLANPEAFASFCQQLRDRYLAQERRRLRSTYARTRLNQELDGHGKPVISERTLERIRFEEGVEKREVVERRDEQTGQALTTSRLPAERPSTILYPFSEEEKPGDYAYQFAGWVEWAGRTLAKVTFEPVEKGTDRLAGFLLADPELHEPVRFEAEPVHPPTFVDSVRMTVDYGPAENGHWQIQRWVTDGVGGFAVIRKRYRVEITYHDYETLPGG